jgi:hypothetical protein
MSYNIPGVLVRHLSKLEAVVDLPSLSPIQIKKLEKYARTGVIKGSGVPATIAKHMRDEAGFPSIVIRKDSVHGYRVTSTEVYKKIAGAMALCRIGGEDNTREPYISSENGCRFERMQTTERFVKQMPGNFQLYYTGIGKHFSLKTMEEMQVDLSNPVVINFNIKV